MSSPTPGFWCAGTGRFKNEREKGELHFAVFDQNSSCLAHVFNEADVRLFAAAPKLLAVLESILEEFDYDLRIPKVEAARVAIAEARGP